MIPKTAFTKDMIATTLFTRLAEQARAMGYTGTLSHYRVPEGLSPRSRDALFQDAAAAAGAAWTLRVTIEALGFDRAEVERTWKRAIEAGQAEATAERNAG